MGKILAFLILSSFAFAQAQESTVPSSEHMGLLKPAVQGRLRAYDRLFPRAGEMAEETHQQYTDPEKLADLDRRLKHMRDTGNPMDIFSEQEKNQFAENFKQLKILEAGFFEQMILKNPMSFAIQTQKVVTAVASPEPKGEKRTSLMQFWQQNREKNILYSSWNKPLEADLQTQSPRTWGDLLIRFNSDARFREFWVQTQPQTLPKLKSMSEVWAWDDSSVRKVKVKNSGTPQEYWVIERTAQNNLPNRFDTIMRGDFEKLVKIEYASTLYFNRLTQITMENGAYVYHLNPVEKGRSMESLDHFDEKGADKKTFRGAEAVRKSKADEFLQRDLVRSGDLNLFLGLRTMPIHEARRLMAVYPELMLAVGQFGFSVTGGTAQTASNRTDGVHEQAAKLTATLIDAIELANTHDVNKWFKNNVKHVLRTIFGGVGAGGHQALTEPGRTKTAIEKPVVNNGNANLCSRAFAN